MKWVIFFRRHDPYSGRWRPRKPVYLASPLPQFKYLYPDYRWIGKRNELLDDDSTGNEKHFDYEYLPDDYDSYYTSVEEGSTNQQLVKAIKQQNKLLQKTYSKISSLTADILETTTEDWDVSIPPSEHTDFQKEQHVDKKTLAHYYFGDD